MKKLTLLSSILIFLCASCSQEEITREEAYQAIKQGEKFPKPIDYDIYRSDPQFAKRAIDAGLEKEGLVNVQRTQKLGDIGRPLIQFTQKAQPYLLLTPEEKAIDVQKVKIAEEDLVEITGIKPENDGKGALVEYMTAYRNTTPFSALMPANFNDKKNVRKARFSLTGNGWKLEK